MTVRDDGPVDEPSYISFGRKVGLSVVRIGRPRKERPVAEQDCRGENYLPARSNVQRDERGRAVYEPDALQDSGKADGAPGEVWPVAHQIVDQVAEERHEDAQPDQDQRAVGDP